MLAEKEQDLAQPSSRSGMRVLLTLIAIGLAALVFSAWKFKVTGQPPFLHRENVWSIAIYEGPSPTKLSPISTRNVPVLSASDVSDVDALFVADPFMVEANGEWYMFVEVLNKKTNQGDIAVASSDDGLSWRYEQIVLDEPWHLSYPSVFQLEDKWYMLPQGNTGVHLYEAESFPTSWKKVATLMQGDDLADPTLFHHDGSWWMFLGRSGTHDRLQLFFADELTGPWTEHPQSPIIKSNPDTARPGGKVVESDGQLFRFAQDCAPKYGNQLRAFRITQLNRTEYAEQPIDGEFVLTAGSHEWNANGMHHVDAHKVRDKWRAVVDGHKKTWSLSLSP